MESPQAEKQKPPPKRGFKISGAGLGIILTINLLLIIYFVDIYRKQRPRESPHKKSLCFCDGCHDESVF
ncbi:hypothetical protein [Dickeya dianthicola]|uniref:hypothetical protein n=1 Tax=Dickeya dianthicola TaxID=204039 RepID=UPI001368A23C|nr:hypothetical protein [Dickeya dianthicola]